MAVGSYAQQTASNTGQPIGIEDNLRTFRMWGTVKLSGTYPTGGDTIDLNQFMTTANGGPGANYVTGSLPIKVEITSIKSSAQANLYVYNYLPGTTLANGTIQVYTGAAAQTGLTELSAGAYPAGVSGDLLQLEMIFPKL